MAWQLCYSLCGKLHCTLVLTPFSYAIKVMSPSQHMFDETLQAFSATLVKTYACMRGLQPQKVFISLKIGLPCYTYTRIQENLYERAYKPQKVFVLMIYIKILRLRQHKSFYWRGPQIWRAGDRQPHPTPHLSGYVVPSMQKLMMFNTTKEKGPFPRKENVQASLFYSAVDFANEIIRLHSTNAKCT